ncbi:MAG: hypothetical protein DCC49_02195 [Acidobacteria bacterium]|nr:MAG: hypothetical protein DCC49_02195 [Acidobacteriota bacterium]
MRIHRVGIRNFRGVDECDVDFSTDGITIVEGPNEVGKSSLIEAINLLFTAPSDSTKKDVKASRPVHRDADPRVELTLQTGDYELTYSKTFGPGRRGETTLQITKPRTESIAGREAHERMSEIIAETLDEGLWAALQFEQGTEISQPTLGESHALQAALDGAAGSTPVSAAEDTLFAKAETEFGKYFTGTGKRKKEIQEQEDAVRELEGREGERETALRDLEELTSTAESLARDRARLEIRLAEAEAEAADLGAKLDNVIAKASEIEQLESELNSAKAELAPVSDAVERRRKLADDEKQYIEQETGLASGRAAVSSDQANARVRVDRAIERGKQANSVLEDCRRIEQIRRTDHDFLRGKLDLEMMGERLARAEAAEQEVAVAQEVVSRSLVDDDALERLRQLEHEAIVKRATLEAGSPSVRLEPHTNSSLVIDGEPEQLRDGHPIERRVTAEAKFEIPEIVTITVRPGSSPEIASRELDDVQANIAGLLADLGVTDLADAKRVNDERREAAGVIKHAEERIRDALRDLSREELKQKVSNLRAFVDAHPETRQSDLSMAADLDDASALLAAAETAREEADEERAEAESERDAAQSQLETLNQQLAKQQADHEQLRGRLAQVREELEGARQQHSDEELEEKLRSKERDVQEKAARLEDGRREYEALEPEKVRARAENASAAVDRCREDRDSTAHDLRDARVKLETLGADGIAEQLDEARSQLEHQRRAWESLWRRAQAAAKLYETMAACRTEAFQRYRAPLREKIEELGRIVFGASFAVELSEDLAISRRALDGVTVPFEQLSVGAREQLSILARLATAALVDPDSGVPVVLDDALGYSDPERLEALGAVIRMIAARQQCQVILLTCYPDRYRFIGDAVTVKLPQGARPSEELASS